MPRQSGNWPGRVGRVCEKSTVKGMRRVISSYVDTPRELDYLPMQCHVTEEEREKESVGSCLFWSKNAPLPLLSTITTTRLVGDWQPEPGPISCLQLEEHHA